MAVVRYFVVFAWFLIGLASRPSMAQTSAGAASWRNLGRFAFGTLTGRPVADTLLVEHSGSVLFQQVADTLLVELSSDSAGGDPGAAATVWVLLSDGNAAKLKSKRALTIGSSAGPPVLQTLFSFEKAAEPEAVVIMRGKQIQVLPVASLVGLFTESTAETAPDSSSNRWDWPFMDLGNWRAWVTYTAPANIPDESPFAGQIVGIQRLGSGDPPGHASVEAATVWVLLSDGTAAKVKARRPLITGSVGGPETSPNALAVHFARGGAEPEAVVIMLGNGIQVFPVASGLQNVRRE